MQEYEYTKRLMGTEVSISLVMDDQNIADEIGRKTLAAIYAYEERFSRFLPTSELSILNEKKDMVVSPIFFTVLTRAYELFLETKGVFNPLVQIARLGYDRDFSTLDEISNINTNEPYNIDFSIVTMDRETRRVVLQEGQRLDFGGFLKGYLAEKLAQSIETAHPECLGIIVNIGGDLHTRGYDEYVNPFVFLIYNPVLETEQEVVVTNRSLATSGSYKRTWKTKDGIRHHILGEKGTANPDTDIISASIIHEHGDTAEAYAKLFLVLGKDHAVALVSKNNYSYVLITRKGEMITNCI